MAVVVREPEKLAWHSVTLSIATRDIFECIHRDVQCIPQCIPTILDEMYGKLHCGMETVLFFCKECSSWD